MRSKVSIKGHPLHPILVSFPIAFLTGTFVCDLLTLSGGNLQLDEMANYLAAAGIAFGVLAAIPGFVDFLVTVPPASSGKKRAAKHGLINATVLILFFTALMLRRSGTSLETIAGLEAAGFIGMAVAGWMGGTLVYRNQIGVDIRYAGAGKWNEEFITEASAPVATKSELKTDQMKLLHIAGKRVVLARTEQGWVAFDDHCTHRGGSLAGGAMACGTVQCPWHGSQFDVATGEVRSGPARAKIKTYAVKEAGGKIFLQDI